LLGWFVSYKKTTDNDWSQFHNVESLRTNFVDMGDHSRTVSRINFNVLLFNNGELPDAQTLYDVRVAAMCIDSTMSDYAQATITLEPCTQESTVAYEATVCRGKDYSGYGFNLPVQQNEGRYLFQRENLSNIGCRITSNLYLTVTAKHSKVRGSICSMEHYAGYGFDVHPTFPGVYLFQRDTVAQDGCDSIIELELTVFPLSQTFIEDTVNDVGEYIWHNNTITEAGYYAKAVQSSHGCDSTLILHLKATSGLELISNQTNQFIFPNPAKENINIQIDNTITNYEIEITDIAGRQILKTGNAKVIDISHLPDNFYFVKIIVADKLIGINKLIIRK
jgi:hypothetical protein